MPNCPACNTSHPPGQKFCDECGGDLPAGSGVRIHIGREASPNPSDQSLVVPGSAGQVSRQQARVYVGPSGDLQIENLSRANGTTVNGVAVQGRAPFRLTDQVKFGSYTFHTARIQPYLAGTGRVRADPAPAPRQPAQAAPAPMIVVNNNNQMNAFGGAPGLGAGLPGKIRSVPAMILLTILTLGIYLVFYQWFVLDELRRWRGGQGWSGAMILMAFIPLVGIAVLAIWFLIPSYVNDLHARHGQTSAVSGWYGLLILIPLLGPFIWMALVQSELNAFWRSQGAVG